MVESVTVMMASLVPAMPPPLYADRFRTFMAHEVLHVESESVADPGRPGASAAPTTTRTVEAPRAPGPSRGTAVPTNPPSPFPGGRREW